MIKQLEMQNEYLNIHKRSFESNENNGRFLISRDRFLDAVKVSIKRSQVKPITHNEAFIKHNCAILKKLLKNSQNNKPTVYHPSQYPAGLQGVWGVPGRK